MLIEIGIMLLLIAANGFFSCAEMAIVASRKGRLLNQAEAGDRRAERALALASSPETFLTTVQIGITLVGTLAAAYGGGGRAVASLEALANRSLPDAAASLARPLALGAFVAVFTYVTMVLGELVPKRLALRKAEGIAKAVAPWIDRLSTLARPLVTLMGFTTSAVLRLVGLNNRDGPTVSVDDIETMLEAGRVEGVLEAVEQAVAAEALRLGERAVRDIMRPRIELDALDIDTPPEEIIGAVAMAGYSRLPVYDGTLDRILGYVSIKDVLRQSWMRRPIELRRILHRPLFVPDSMPLDRLLEAFQQDKTQLAIVLDEYGGTEGLVTLEDVFEELVGEIHDEHARADEQAFVQRLDGSWLVDGSVSIDEFCRRVGVGVPEGPRTYTTVSGMVLETLERIPDVADRLQWNGLDIEVVDMDGRRIDRLLVRRPNSTERM
ncbi:MAG: hemolysin family protein [Planctomycetaceae bacterium]